ncbi:MAG: S1 RNA-binding domain-containing protein, partial [Ignavibacteriae bacterium]|nr:S1 RNA-binding domain-containing protein [Ignavibacteriota bacterium]
QEGVKEIKDLKPGMQLEGVVTNVANFGAFIDIGVHQDGLVHVSQLADRFVEDPKKVVKVGQIVKVRVLEVNEALKRISLSMKSPEAAAPKARDEKHKGERGTPSKPKKTDGKHTGKKPERHSEHHFTLDDLKAKFNKR